MCTIFQLPITSEDNKVTKREVDSVTDQERLIVQRAVRLFGQLGTDAVEVVNGWDYAPAEIVHYPPAGDPRRSTWLSLRWLFAYIIRYLPDQSRTAVCQQIGQELSLATS